MRRLAVVVCLSLGVGVVSIALFSLTRAGTGHVRGLVGDAGGSAVSGAAVSLMSSSGEA